MFEELVPEVLADLGTVHSLVAPRGPTGAIGKPGSMVLIPDRHLPGLYCRAGRGQLHLEMALQAERCVALEQHARVNGSVRIVAGGATIAQRLVMEHERTFLRHMALEAGVIGAHQRGPAALGGISLVRVVAIHAAHPPLENRMRVRQVKLCPHFHMALEAGLRRFAGVEDRVRRAARLDVLAAGAMARFATDVLRVLALRLEPRMGRSRKVARDFRMAVRAALGADEGRSRNAGRRHDRAGKRAARHQSDTERNAGCGDPNRLARSTLEPLF